MSSHATTEKKFHATTEILDHLNVKHQFGSQTKDWSVVFLFICCLTPYKLLLSMKSNRAQLKMNQLQTMKQQKHTKKNQEPSQN